jgi:hypothetical protein
VTTPGELFRVVDGPSLTLLEEITVHARLAFRALAAVALSALTASAVMAQASAQQAPQVSVTGVVYSQFLYQLKDTANHFNDFSVTRSYVNVVGRFAGGIQTRVTVDVAPAAAGNQPIRLKFAYFGYTPTGSPLTYKFGLLHTPWLDWEETLWDYRMQGSMAEDRNLYATAADFGAGVDGHWDGERINGQLTFVNGEGYSGGARDQRKDLQARVSVRVKPTNDNSRVGGVRVTGYVGIGKATGGADRNRYIGMLSYRTTQYTVAGEYASNKDGGTTGSVISAFGVYHFNRSKFSGIARVDLLDPDNNVSGDHQTRIIAGVSYQVSANLRLLLDVDNLSYQGGSPSPALEAVRFPILFQTQFTF